MRIAILAAPDFGDLLGPERHLLDQEHGVGGVHQRFAAHGHAGVADLAHADAGDALFVVVRLQGGQVVGRAVLGGIEHVQRVDDHEANFLLLDQDSDTCRRNRPRSCPCDTGFPARRRWPGPSGELGLVQAGGRHADLGHA